MYWLLQPSGRPSMTDVVIPWKRFPHSRLWKDSTGDRWNRLTKYQLSGALMLSLLIKWKAVEQTLAPLVSWYSMTLMWRHYHAYLILLAGHRILWPPPQSYEVHWKAPGKKEANILNIHSGQLSSYWTGTRKTYNASYCFMTLFSTIADIRNRILHLMMITRWSFHIDQKGKESGSQEI